MCIAKFIGRKVSIWRAFFHVSRRVLLYFFNSPTSSTYMYVVFILQCHVCLKKSKFYTKRSKNIVYFELISHWVSTARFALDQRLRYFALQKTQVQREVYSCMHLYIVSKWTDCSIK